MTTPLKVRLVVGLGNPGSEYDGTRHNVGFDVVDHLAERLNTLFRGPSKLDGWTGPRGFQWARADVPPFTEDASDEAPAESAALHPAFLLKPGTYMNRSGDLVAPVARFLAKRGELAALDPGTDAAATDAPIVPDPASILVVYDDMDLDVGRLRLRPHGGHGGQNGMRSIIHRLETDGFPRLRVGIGRSGTDAARHVLSPFNPSESEDIQISVAQATDALMAWLGGMDLADVMTRFHSRWNQSL